MAAGASAAGGGRPRLCTAVRGGGREGAGHEGQVFLAELGTYRQMRVGGKAGSNTDESQRKGMVKDG